MEEVTNHNRLYSLESAAKQLGISVWTLRSHARKGGALRTTRVGRRVLVSASELARIEASGLPSLAAQKPDSTNT
jgi:excisionase family DNA binding protein